MAISTDRKIRLYQKGTLEAFEAFCKECIKITGGDDESGDTSAIPFRMWPSQRELAAALLDPEVSEIIVLKSRQIGITWVVLAWKLYRVMFWHGIEERITSVGQEESAKALRRVKFMIDNLPEWCMPTLEVSNTTTVKIGETQSWITALPATINAGRGDTLNDILSDEAAFQVYAKQIVSSARPALEKRHGKLIAVSTANGVGNWFQEEYVKAEQGKNGFKPFFFGWQADPTRSKEWYARMLREHGAEYMHENYPETSAQAFLASGRPYYEQTRVVDDIGKPLPPFHDGFLDGKEFFPSAQGALRVWKKPVSGHSYVAWADTAEGLEHGDWNNAYFLDAESLEICARVRGKMDSSEYADLLMVTGYWYAGPFLPALLCVERNAGMAVLKRILEAGYPNVYQDRNLLTGEVKADTYGWHTNVSTRQTMLGKSQALYRMGRAAVIDMALLEEMALFSHRGPRGKPQAPPGKNDDCVMSWAGAVFIATYEAPIAEEEKAPDDTLGTGDMMHWVRKREQEDRTGKDGLELNVGLEEMGG